MRIENLKASALNVSEYRAAIAALKASQPTKALDPLSQRWRFGRSAT